ncbi:exodeoxyribonuclease V subunit beta [Acidovorax sp. HDW3]|uniref:exodeoxyribonuclease V subunit beta n=1 Tax=Acidovorax sp. HDW3 TaxID=2714923 RepID=UPI0014091098|nr:exodeoxyribonuclease V subunit beta [Acidovorax sp. HDW3]QIL43490.1 exodeoxyribonuclease V subunit beta [Acidovorax sp. HDW3]
MPSHPLAPLTFPLHGSRLIEASAGTGKTWTIAALYLRLVLGHGGESGFARPLLPPDILVMTFTRAATRELSDRIRARLVQAAACFRGQEAVPASDGFLQGLLAGYADSAAREAAAWRLQLAAEGMDEAAIHTIDAWCQRMLREHAFDSGSLFDETLEADEDERRTQAAQDYWRQQVYPLQGAELDAVLAQWPTVDDLAADMQELVKEPLESALGTGDAGALITQIETERSAQLAALAAGWAQRTQQFEDWLDGELAHNKSAWNGKKLQARYYKPWFQALRDWAAAPHADLAEKMATGATRLTPSGLDEARSGDVPTALHPASQALADLLAALAQVPATGPALRQHAAVRVQQRLLWLKQQAGTFGFADMLARLNAALTGARGAALRAAILAQYPVALVDEFQDTSPVQYQLFDHIYRTASNDAASALLLIGDPKQSIYGFRGADIYSYLQARGATAGRHYVLGTNYRSTKALVAAVNHWFTHAEQRPGSGAFQFRQWQDGVADNPLPFEAVAAQGRAERFVIQGEDQPALHLAWHRAADGEPMKNDDLQQHLAQCCAEQIVQWLAEPSAGFAHPEKGFTRLKASDIAILVRKKKEADAVRGALQRRGVASVYLSDRESVLASDEAQDLLLWLRAVAAPLDLRSLRAALATRLMGLTLPELEPLAHDDALLDAASEQLRQLHGVWQRQGVLALVRQILHRFGLPARWLQNEDGNGERRLTNVLHLAELLQSASAELEGEHALIRWLAEHISAPGGEGDEQTLRLESDADLVKVVTIHKSKGLEYPLVCIPFASSYQPKEKRNTALLRLPQPGGGHALHLTYTDEELQLADDERLREDLRLLYVALTRARHALWLGWGPLRRGTSKACVNERSASGYLLAGDAARSQADWLQQLQIFCAAAPHTHCAPVPPEVPTTRLPPTGAAAPLQPAPAYAADFDRRWGIASFSALVRDIASGHASAPPQAAPDLLPAPLPTAPLRPADDEPEAAPAATAGAQPWQRFPAGPLVGNFIHDQLQWLSDEGFALGPAQAAQLQRRCQRAGYSEAQAADLHAWLAAAVQHPLAPLGASLAQLQEAPGHQRLAEMEFWLPVDELPAAAIDALCRRHILPGQPRPPLPERSLHGMLMGFADLVFAHAGRYWVLDYKTNRLGPNAASYDRPALQTAMLAHRYDVQALLYLLALHRLLRQRLGAAYDPAAQLGGALYYFVRGLDGPAASLHTEAAPLALLDGLEELMPKIAPNAYPASASSYQNNEPLVS